MRVHRYINFVATSYSSTAKLEPVIDRLAGQIDMSSRKRFSLPVLLAFFLVLLFLAGAGFTLPGGRGEEIVCRDADIRQDTGP
jgi:hypothetical protein